MRNIMFGVALMIAFAGGTSVTTASAADASPDGMESCRVSIPYIGCLYRSAPKAPDMAARAEPATPAPAVAKPCLLPATLCGEPVIEAAKLDQLQNSQELAERTMWLSFSSDQTIREALIKKAEEVCGVGKVAILDVDRPDYIRVPMSPHGYVHCAP